MQRWWLLFVSIFSNILLIPVPSGAFLLKLLWLTVLSNYLLAVLACPIFSRTLFYSSLHIRLQLLCRAACMKWSIWFIRSSFRSMRTAKTTRSFLSCTANWKNVLRRSAARWVVSANWLVRVVHEARARVCRVALVLFLTSSVSSVAATASMETRFERPGRWSIPVFCIPLLRLQVPARRLTAALSIY